HLAPLGGAGEKERRQFLGPRCVRQSGRRSAARRTCPRPRRHRRAALVATQQAHSVRPGGLRRGWSARRGPQRLAGGPPGPRSGGTRISPRHRPPLQRHRDPRRRRTDRRAKGRRVRGYPSPIMKKLLFLLLLAMPLLAEEKGKTFDGPAGPI